MKNTIKHITLLGGIHQGFNWFAVGLIIPVLSLLQIEKGLSLLQIGYTAAAYGVTVMVLELPTGGLADAIGRKRVYLMALFFRMLSAGILLTARGFSPVFFGFITMGISRALSSGSVEAYFIDALEAEDPGADLQKPLAFIDIFITAGLAAGSLLGGWLPMSLGRILVRAGLGDLYTGNFIVSLIASIIQLVFTLLVIHEERGVRIAGPSRGVMRKFSDVFSSGLKYAFSNYRLVLLITATLTWGLVFSGLEGYWQPRVREIIGGGGTMIFGILSTAYFAVGALGSLLSIPVSRVFRGRHGLTMVFLRIISGGFFIFLARGSSLASFSVFYLLVFCTNGVSGSPHAAMVNRIVPSERRATILSLESLFLQTGGAIGSLTAGFVSEHYSIGTAWIIGGIVYILSALLYAPLASFVKDVEVQS